MQGINKLTWLLLLLLMSCSKIDDNNGGDGELNKEFVIHPNEFAASGVLTENLSTCYPIQLFRKSSLIDNGIFNEVNANMHPYSLIFNFLPRPYTAEITRPNGILSFIEARASAMNSDEWRVYNESGTTTSLHLACAIYSSEDKAKKFLGDSSLYRLLGKNEYKYTFVAKIISSKFNVITHTEEVLTDDEIDDACYISSITYGRYAYLSIQVNENPEKILDIFKNGILGGDLSYVDKYVEIASSVNVIEKGGNGNGGYWGKNGFYKLIEIFNPNRSYTGVPILFELKDIKTKEVVYPIFI